MIPKLETYYSMCLPAQVTKLFCDYDIAFQGCMNVLVFKEQVFELVMGVTQFWKPVFNLKLAHIKLQNTVVFEAQLLTAFRHIKFSEWLLKTYDNQTQVQGKDHLQEFNIFKLWADHGLVFTGILTPGVPRIIAKGRVLLFIFLFLTALQLSYPSI